jgi:hypothetical protein
MWLFARLALFAGVLLIVFILLFTAVPLLSFIGACAIVATGYRRLFRRRY